MPSLLKQLRSSFAAAGKTRHKAIGATWLSETIQDADTRALYLLLLGRAPESDEIYAQNRGRQRGDLLNAIIRSPEFRDRVGSTAATQPWHDAESLQFVRGWLERVGIALDGAALDWSDAFAAFYGQDRVAASIRQALPGQAAEIEQRLAVRRRLRAALRLPSTDPDVRALFLLLLHREPENAEVYAAHRGRLRLDLAASILASPEFRAEVLEPFLAQQVAAQQWLVGAACGAVRAWLEGLGLKLPDPAVDWLDLFMAFWAEAPAAALLGRADREAAARLGQRLCQIRQYEPWGRAPADGADVKAIYLGLLGRLPESDEIYTSNKGRPRVDLVGGILRSPEFHQLMLAPLLSHGAIAQDRLGQSEANFMKVWLARTGVALPGGEPDWAELVAMFLTEGPAARVVLRAIAEHAPNLVANLSALRHSRAFGRLSLQDNDVRAVYLLLLGRAPESAAIYDANRGRPRAELIAAIVQSPEFRNNVLTPFLADADLPQRRLDDAALQFARSWAQGAGIAPPIEPRDYAGLLAAFLRAVPAGPLVAAATQGIFEQRIADATGASAAERRARSRLATLSSRLEALEAGWRQHVPGLLNAVSSVGAFGHEQARLAREVEALRHDLDQTIERSAGDLRRLSERLARIERGEGADSGAFPDLGIAAGGLARQPPTAE